MGRQALKSGVDRHLAHYLKVLGLRPGASPEDVATAYFALRKSLPDLDSEESMRRIRAVDHAFAILKVRYRRRHRQEVIHRRINKFLIGSACTLILLGLFSWFHFSDRLRPYLARLDPGERVYRLQNRALYGKVLAHEENHLFPAGVRQEAYLIALHPSGKEIWIAARTARTALTTR